jgi:phospholipase C
LTTGATGLPMGVLDTRVPGAGTLPPGPFVLQGPNISDDDYTGDMTHRYYQAFQQQDCSLANATKDNPTGCLNDLFAFVMATYSATNKSAGNEMGFYNAEQEQATLLKTLADRFTLSDNFHQSFLGGTGANHFMFGTGDAGFWSDGNGNPATPPASLIANPNPKPGTVNTYTADNAFSNCSDITQPGVQPIIQYIESLPYNAEPNCAHNAYYMLDNTNPGYFPNGSLVPAVQNALPPSSVKTIGDALTEKNISWAYFGGAYNDAVVLSDEAVAANPSNPNLTTAALADPAHALGVAYCQICNPFQYAASIMGDTAQRTAHIKDTADLITDIKQNTLPAVSVGKPDGLLDGHPQSSKVDLFEALCAKHPRCARGQAEPQSRDGGVHHLGRGGRILGFGVHSAARFFWRWTADSAARALVVLDGRQGQSRLCRSRLAAEVHRAQLAPPASDRSQPRQFPQSKKQKEQPLRSHQHAGARRFV